MDNIKSILEDYFNCNSQFTYIMDKDKYDISNFTHSLTLNERNHMNISNNKHIDNSPVSIIKNNFKTLKIQNIVNDCFFIGSPSQFKLTENQSQSKDNLLEEHEDKESVNNTTNGIKLNSINFNNIFISTKIKESEQENMPLEEKSVSVIEIIGNGINKEKTECNFIRLNSVKSSHSKISKEKQFYYSGTNQHTSPTKLIDNSNNTMNNIIYKSKYSEVIRRIQYRFSDSNTNMNVLYYEIKNDLILLLP